MPDDASGNGRDERGRDDGSAREGYTADFGSPSSADSEERDDTTATGRGSDRDRIPLDLSGDDDPAATTGDEEDDPYAPEPNSTPVEAGDPSLENAIFVVLGAVAMVLVGLRVLSIPL